MFSFFRKPKISTFESSSPEIKLVVADTSTGDVKYSEVTSTEPIYTYEQMLEEKIKVAFNITSLDNTVSPNTTGRSIFAFVLKEIENHH